MRKEFEDFVNNMPSSAVINNRCWEECAVGTFALEQNLYYREVVGKLYQDYGTNGAFDFFEIESFYGVVGVKIHKFGTVMDMLNNSKFNTYGELQTFLKDYQG